ncbi:hypothetical protein A2V82_13535 [candidate division KSB1 bacterium RBG_16_48_16]|nr:MAG: hypothetical protein A2V82_13535 [candidate division KSB1 bacterium RBG_16_48_16]
MAYHVSSILTVVLSSIKDFWPYMLATIPLAVIIQLSGAARYIKNALQARPHRAILLATLVGAFSPFCSCGVIPVIITLLMSGVPLAPVMSFWIASPSMDPEILFLSVATLGWNLAIWRLASTLIISLSAGFITHAIVRQKWIDESEILRRNDLPLRNFYVIPKLGFSRIVDSLKQATETMLSFLSIRKVALNTTSGSQMACCVAATAGDKYATVPDGGEKSACGCRCNVEPDSQWKRVLKETWNASCLVFKFMILAFLVKALIVLYLPSEYISGLLGRQNSFSIFTAAMIGIPMYTSNLAALPLVSGLLAQGMNPAAALAFLIAGPTTTLPAMAAVWGVANRRVFLLYLFFSLCGALFFGYLYTMMS